MKKPAQLKPWLSTEELTNWVREAPDRNTYQKRLAVWLTHLGPFHAHKVADMLQISKQAVWLWVKQFNKSGPGGLKRKGRGGRRWAFLSWEKEEDFLRSLEEKALTGQVLTAKHILPELRKKVGRDISLDYVYRLLHRHSWRKLGPRPRHIKSDKKAQEDFKKNFRPLSRKR